LSFCKSHVLTARFKCFQKSFMATAELFFSDGSFLSLDLITRLVRKNLVFMNAAQMIDRSSCNSEGIKLPSSQDDLSYLILFTTLNNSIMPDKYQKFYASLSEAKQDEILQFVYSKYGIYGENLKQMFQHIYKNATLIKRSVSNHKRNKGLKLLMNSCRYVFDTVRSLLFRKGFVITFSGVDGAGKSTLIADVAQRLERDYRKKVIVLRHRPSLLPILSVYRYGKKKAEQRASQSLPHQGKNKGFINSCLRFAYYFTDYLLGQIYVSIRYVSRGYVVLYDRYYFDFINDSKRSNIVISKKFASQMYALIYKPKYNFFFYASPETIRERKKELSAVEISRMTQNYFSTFKRFEEKYAHSQYHCIENINREETLKKVFQQVQQSL